MKIYKTVLAIVAVLLIQTMVLNRFYWLRFIDLFLLLNIYYALHFSPLTCIGVSLTSGLFQDTFSRGIVGMNAFSKTVIAYLTATLSSRLMLKHPIIIMFLIAISTVIDFTMIFGLHRIFGLPVPNVSIKLMWIAALFNTLIGIVGFQITDRIRVKKEYA